jgi:hypothetical protein
LNWRENLKRKIKFIKEFKTRNKNQENEDQIWKNLKIRSWIQGWNWKEIKIW